MQIFWTEIVSKQCEYWTTYVEVTVILWNIYKKPKIHLFTLCVFADTLLTSPCSHNEIKNESKNSGLMLNVIPIEALFNQHCSLTIHVTIKNGRE